VLPGYPKTRAHCDKAPKHQHVIASERSEARRSAAISNLKALPRFSLLTSHIQLPEG